MRNQNSVMSFNEAKIKLLQVSPTTLELHGAVSSETALEMAQNARKLTNSTLGISITGIAGPGGGTAQKPVGLVYIGFSSENTSFFKELNLSGDRDRIRNLTSLNALDIIRKHILDLKILN